jgi:hypothetical protein
MSQLLLAALIVWSACGIGESVSEASLLCTVLEREQFCVLKVRSAVVKPSMGLE